MMFTTASTVPDPDALLDSPELATLDVLERVLAVAINVLLAVNGELMDDNFIEDAPACGTTAACLADAVLTHVDGLSRALRRYRDFTRAAASTARRLPADF